MKMKCPTCKKVKDSVGPKYIGQGKTVDPRLNNPVQTVYTRVMCNDCLDLHKQEKLDLTNSE